MLVENFGLDELFANLRCFCADDLNCVFGVFDFRMLDLFLFGVLIGVFLLLMGYCLEFSVLVPKLLKIFRGLRGGFFSLGEN